MVYFAAERTQSRRFTAGGKHMNRIKKIVFAALAAAALTGAAGAAHLDRPVQGSSSVSAGIRSSSAASEVVRLTNSARGQNGDAALVEDGALSEAVAVRARDRAQLFAYTPVGCAIQFGAQRERCELSPGGGETSPPGQKKRVRGRNAWMNPPGQRANILNSNYAHRLCERQYRRHAFYGAAFRGLTGADRYSLPA